jgi:hypothetical protein
MSRLLALASFLACLGLHSAAFADLPAGMHYDDGFAYYSVVSRGVVNDNRPTDAYYFSANARILGNNIARDSAFRFVYKQGGRTLLTVTCNGRPTYRAAYLPTNPPDGFTVANCTNAEKLMDAAGEVSVEVTFIDDGTDKEHLVATHTVEVVRIRKENHARKEQPADYIVNQYGASAVVLLDQVGRGQHHVFGAMDGNEASGSAPQSEVNLVFLRASGASPNSDVTLRCSVDGTRLDFGNARIRASIVQERSSRAIQALSDGRNAVQEPFHYTADRYRLPIYFGEVEGMGVRLEDHPGRWECSLRDSERRPIRDFAFSVAGGLIQPHAEEKSGLHFPAGVHLADVSILGANAVDERTDPASAQAIPFYGRGWQTDEGRAMGKRVAVIGEPFPSSVRRSAPRPARAPR